MSVKYGILTLLYVERHHGYELKLEMDSLLGMKGKVNPGQIYTTLDRLIRDELVSSPGLDDQDRKLFELEQKGKDQVEKWLLEPVPYHSTKDDFFFKWNCSRRIGFQDEDKMLQNQKEVILKGVMELTSAKTEALMKGDENTYLWMSGLLLHLEADLNWIMQVENRIR
ncbi:hypothetical protein D479_12223 [Halobacillus sp. BAB-2008]|nr:hypothetical protein D479_12223 [Halobacillus sp. BAB-2008]